MKFLLQNSHHRWFMPSFASCFFTFLFFVFLASPQLFSQDWSIRHFGTDEGLPGNITYKTIQDEIGYMWIPTNNGIVRFDGKEFKSYNSPLIKNNEILRCRSIQGGIWLQNFSGKVFVIRNDKIFDFNPNGILDNKTVVDLLEDQFGQLLLLVSCSSGKIELFVVNQNNKDNIPSIKKVELPQAIRGNMRLYLKKMDQSVFIIGNQHILEYHADSNAISTVSFNEDLSYPLPVKLQNRHLICYKNRHQATPQYAEYKNQKWEKLNLPFSPHPAIINGVFQDTKSRIWTYGDELILWDSNFRPIKNLTKSINEQHVNEIQEDREGNIWISTNGDGLYVVYNSPFIQYNEKNSNLPSNYIFDLDGDQNGNVFLISHPGWLTRMQGDQLKDHLSISDSKSEMYDVMISKNNEVLVSLEDTYFFDVDSRQNNTSLRRTGNLNFGAKRYYETSDEELFLVSGGGILSFLDSTIMIAEPFKDAGIKVYCLLKDKQNSLILGSNKGIYSMQLQGKKELSKQCTVPIKSLNQNKALCSIPQMKAINLDFLIKRNQLNKNLIIRHAGSLLKKHYFKDSLTIDYYTADIKKAADETIWVATRSNGLYQIKNNKIIHHYTASETGLSSNICNRIFIDSNNLIWLATVNGLNRVDPRQKIVRKISVDDGLNSNHVTSVYKNKTKIYVGTAKGLTVFSENDIKQTAPPPSVMLRDIKINEKDTLLQASYDLKWSQNSLYIGFIAPFFQGKISYQYRLKGAFSNWIQTTDNYARFAELNPGKYIFEVNSKSKDGQVSKELASVEIRIRPHPLKSALAYLLYGLFVCCTLGFIYWWRIRQIKRREAEKTVINKKFAELELQALQAQMNPHFVFNAMNAIQNYIAQQDVHQANKYLSDFGKLMRLFLDSTRKKYIYIDEEIELLQLYLKLEKLRFREKIDIIFNISPSLERDIEIPSLILQPFIENAINHGLSNKAENGTLKINMDQEENHINITIEDDGVGREQAAKIKQKSFKAYESYGMKIVEERLATLDLIDDYKVKIEIVDLKNEATEPIGTRVAIQIPVID